MLFFLVFRYQEGLRLKISRERVGIEVDKMLGGMPMQLSICFHVCFSHVSGYL